MASCAAVNKAGHACSWESGHRKYGFVGITSVPGVSTTTAERPTIEVHGFWNSEFEFWEIWPATTQATTASSPTKGF
jgi:hypothetical protein